MHAPRGLGPSLPSRARPPRRHVILAASSTAAGSVTLPPQLALDPTTNLVATLCGPQIEAAACFVRHIEQLTALQRLTVSKGTPAAARAADQDTSRLRCCGTP